MRTELVLLACLASLVAAQEPQRCVAISQFEARETSFDFERRFEREAKFGYDAPNERFYRYEELNENATRNFYHEIFLHQERAFYRIDLKTRACQRFPLERPFYPIAVPPDARYYASRYLGSSAIAKANLLTTVWVGEDEERHFGYEMVFTERECLPVHVTRFFRESRSMERSTFFDATLGITDPTGFEVPPECERPPPPENQL
ncbi:mammalian ependymin-related protein 1-like [Oscarella lobularis]|uniref:mammalian ependymin-related protein 1-like n=1 Tax=Oscarella lobularis TaxID=121494 RepID=UPI003313630C